MVDSINFQKKISKEIKNYLLKEKKSLATYPLNYEDNTSKIKEIKEMNEFQIDDIKKEIFLEIEHNSHVWSPFYLFCMKLE